MTPYEQWVHDGLTARPESGLVDGDDSWPYDDLDIGHKGITDDPLGRNPGELLFDDPERTHPNQKTRRSRERDRHHATDRR